MSKFKIYQDLGEQTYFRLVERRDNGIDLEFQDGWRGHDYWERLLSVTPQGVRLNKIYIDDSAKRIPVALTCLNYPMVSQD